jgi:hypothetical protein
MEGVKNPNGGIKKTQRLVCCIRGVSLERPHFQHYVVALVAVIQTSAMPATATPQDTSKPSKPKLETNSNQPKKPVKEAEEAQYPKTDNQFIERAIKTHVPAPGQFIKRRQRIWETLKRNYAQKKDISKVLSEYVKMNDAVSRGTNWVMDDAGTYTRRRPLSLQCKELEDALHISGDLAK